MNRSPHLRTVPDAVIRDLGGHHASEAHVFDAGAILAVDAALAADRPLLVRGEPGTGKSQLALAAAKVLGWPCVSRVVDARTEPNDLLWSQDAVARLGEAQLLGALGGMGRDALQALAKDRLALQRFLAPGPLWWAFDWITASGLERAVEPCEWPPEWRPGHGVVVLLDEMDKADPDVPNALLEALGSGRFHPPGHPTVRALGQHPLVIVTTNEERSLPDAFVRRCLVLQIDLPARPEELVARARAHFADAGSFASVWATAAVQLYRDRDAADKAGHPKPGQAEYLDLIRALAGLHPGDETAQHAVLADVARFTYRKHPGSVTP